MMHAKTVVVDDAWSVVGSANMDERSMELNEENVLGIADESSRGRWPRARAGLRALEGDQARAVAPAARSTSARWSTSAKVLIEQY